MKSSSIFVLLMIIILLFTIAFISFFHFNNNQTRETKAESKILLTESSIDYVVITETPVPTATKSPTPTPTILPTSYQISTANSEELFTLYSNNQSINRELLKKIAICESGLNPNARFLDYGGLFQFSTGSWISTRINMNLPTDPNLRFNPEEAIKTAAFVLATRGAGAWPNCGK